MDRRFTFLGFSVFENNYITNIAETLRHELNANGIFCFELHESNRSQKSQENLESGAQIRLCKKKMQRRKFSVVLGYLPNVEIYTKLFALTRLLYDHVRYTSNTCGQFKNELRENYKNPWVFYSTTLKMFECLVLNCPN